MTNQQDVEPDRSRSSMGVSSDDTADRSGGVGRDPGGVVGADESAAAGAADSPDVTDVDFEPDFDPDNDDASSA